MISGKGDPPTDPMKTIAWDIDDVLNNLTETWLETEWLPRKADCRRVRYQELSANPPHGLIGVSKAVYLESLDRFRQSETAARMQPEKILTGWFRAHGDRYRHIALTARPRASVIPAIEWVMRHFGEWFQSFSYVPSERAGQSSRQPDRSKADYLAWLEKVDFFIDDQPENCLAAERLGIRVFLLKQPWNRSPLTLKDILDQLTDRFASEDGGTGKEAAWQATS